MIGWIRENNRAAPAVRTLVHFFFDVVCKRRRKIFMFRGSDDNCSPQQKGAIKTRYKISFGRYWLQTYGDMDSTRPITSVFRESTSANINKNIQQPVMSIWLFYGVRPNQATHQVIWSGREKDDIKRLQITTNTQPDQCSLLDSLLIITTYRQSWRNFSQTFGCKDKKY